MNSYGNTAGATCNEEQVEICRDAVADDRLDALPSGGECISKPYLEFSHVCAVTDYLPTVDYCCCHYRRELVLCCRYHQDWNNFRCSESDDVVESSPIVNGSGGGQSGLLRYPSLHVLLPSILIPVAVLVCVAVACVRCYRRHVRNEQRYLAASTASGANHRERCFNGTNKRLVSAAGTGLSDDNVGGRCHDDDGTTTPLTWSSLPTVDRASYRSSSIVDLFSDNCGRAIGDGGSAGIIRHPSTVEPSAPPQPPDYHPSCIHLPPSCCPSGPSLCVACGHPPNYQLLVGGGGYDVTHEQLPTHNRCNHEQQQHRCHHHCHHHHPHHHHPYRQCDHQNPTAASETCCGCDSIGFNSVMVQCPAAHFDHQPPPPYNESWVRT